MNFWDEEKEQTEREKKFKDFEDAFGSLSGEDKVHIYDDTEGRVSLGTFSLDQFSSPYDIEDFCRDKFLKKRGKEKGTFLVQLRKDGKLSKGYSFQIADPDFKEPSAHNGNDRLLDKIENLERSFQEKGKDQSFSREGFLKELAFYKELFSPAQNSVDLQKIYSDVMKAQQEGFNLGLNIQNAQGGNGGNSLTRDLIEGVVGGFLQSGLGSKLLSGLTGANPQTQSYQQPVFINPQPEQNKQTQREEPIYQNVDENNQEGIDMQMQTEIRTIFKKVRKIAKTKDEEKKADMINTLSDEIFDFYLEDIEASLNVVVTSSLLDKYELLIPELIEEQLPSLLKIMISSIEMEEIKKVVLLVFARLKEMLKESESEVELKGA